MPADGHYWSHRFLSGIVNPIGGVTNLERRPFGAYTRCSWSGICTVIDKHVLQIDRPRLEAGS
jgi:hypothetical protein